MSKPETRVKWPPTTSMDAAGLYEPIKKLAELALRFSTVDRMTRLPDGAPESDTDHTVMLGWIAPALAARCSDDLNVGLVAQFALVHDAPEVLAGDTPTLRITAEERAAKAGREATATELLARMFGASLPWFPEMILRYEQRHEPEARFVWALDKVIVKIANLFAGCHDITAQSVTAEEFVAMVAAQRPTLEQHAGGYLWSEGLLRVYDRLCLEVEARLRELALPQDIPDNEAATAVTFEESGHVEYVCPGEHEDGGWSCQFCAGGLFSCTRCGSFEGATTTHCPGRQMTKEESDAVYAGRLDFRREAPESLEGPNSGMWVLVGSPHTPNRGWESRKVMAEIDDFPIDAAIEHVQGRSA
ncbi:MAG TPA: HD domain-containing protein [Propionibacteriaceae bacterium]|nr:HD domain-containing protein [Propionibacteriaceae bacterium]